MRTELVAKTVMALFVGAVVWSTNCLIWTVTAQDATPVITSFSPATDIYGAAVTIRGNNLVNVTKVTFNGVEASFTEFTSSRLFTEVPAHATTGPITVTTAAGEATSADIFTVINPNVPGITGLSPTEGKPGTPVQIDGTNLVTATSVKFNGLEATFAVNGGVLFGTVPTSATTGPVTVTTPEGSSTSADIFTVLKSETAPVIKDFKPKTGDAGATVQISGSNLSAVTSVSFNGVAATFRPFGGILIATVPANGTTGPITVISPSGTDSTTEVFTITSRPPPAITGFNPKSGPVGTSVSIEGDNLINVTAVRFGGVNATFSLFGASVTATVPASAGTGPITVVTTAGSATTPDLFTVTELPKPAITGFDPASGEPGVQIHIEGSHLSDATSVKFNGVEAAFNVLAGSIFATVPTNAVSGPISITTPAGNATSAGSFTVLVPAGEPGITDFSPTSGPVGQIVSIHGTNLTEVTAVKFNGVDAVFTNLVSNLISAIVPTNATTGPITVFTTTSTNATPVPFTVTIVEPPALPIVSSFLPTNGLAGASVEIHGTNFTDVIAVRFNGVEAAFTATSSTLLAAKVPTNAVTGPITVTTAAGTGASDVSFQIDKVPDPIVPPVMAMHGAAAAQVEISWPDSAKDFVLQENQNVADKTGWKNVTVPPVHSDGNYRTTVAAGTGFGFYRLVHP